MWVVRGWPTAIAVGVCVAGSAASVASAAPGDVVAAGGSTVVRVDPRTGGQTVVSSGGLLTDVTGVTRTPDGAYVALARVEDPGPSRLVRVDPTTGAQSVFASAPTMHYAQLAPAAAPNGDVYFSQEGQDLGIYRAKPDGTVTLVTNGAISRANGGDRIDDSPMGLFVDPDGTLWALMEYTGIVHVDTTTGKMTVFSSNAISVRHGGVPPFGEPLQGDPRQFTRGPDGDFWVVDDPAVNSGGELTPGDTALYRVDHATGKATLVSDNARSLAAGGQAWFFRPYAVAVAADGEVGVADLSGRVIRVDPDTGAQSLVSEYGGLDTDEGILFEPGSVPTGRTLVVRTTGVGSGTVDSLPSGIDCGHAAQVNGAQAPSQTTCSATYATTTSVELHAHPDAGSGFAGFSGGGCSGTASTCTVSVDAVRHVEARFTGHTVTITTQGTALSPNNGAGYIRSFPNGLDCGRHLAAHVACTMEMPDGDALYVSSDGGGFPAAGDTFAGFGGGSCSGTATCQVTVDQDRSVTASFSGPVPTSHTITVTPAGTGSGVVTSLPAGVDCGRNLAGHATCATSFDSGRVDASSQLVLAAYPAPGSTFTGFTGGGCAPGDTRCALPLSANTAVTATFSADGPAQRALSVSVEGAGGVTTAPAGIDCGTRCSESFDDGTRVELFAHPADGATFTGWSGNGCSGTATTCEVTMDQARAVAATFSAAAVPQHADLTAVKVHDGDFRQGDSGRTYTITVLNNGAGATTGTVTVSDALPAGLRATAITGTGWQCTTAPLRCTRDDALPAGQSYPPVVVTVDVAADAPASVTNVATVSGGGETATANDTASDPTTVTAHATQDTGGDTGGDQTGGDTSTTTSDTPATTTTSGATPTPPPAAPAATGAGQATAPADAARATAAHLLGAGVLDAGLGDVGTGVHAFLPAGGATARLTGRTIALMALVCDQGCRGTLTATIRLGGRATPVGVKARAASARQATFAVTTPGGGVVLKVALSADVLRRVRAAGRVKATLTVGVTAGGTTKRFAKRFALAAP